MAEVWLRGLPVTTGPLRHLLLCTLQQTEEDVIATTAGLTDEQVWLRPHGLTPIGFHLRHIAESIDRLLTYAQGRSLEESQLSSLKSELTETLPLLSLIAILEQKLEDARQRVNALREEDFKEIREIGRAKIQVPMGTILAHVAEHTQRHLGQLATTVKVVKSTQAGNPA